MSSDDPEDWFATLDDVKRWSKDDPGDFIASLIHEITSCQVVLEGYTKIIFDHVDISELEREEDISIKDPITRNLARLQYLIEFMHEYRKTLD